MPVYVNEMTTDVTVVDGELPLNEAQLETLVKLVLERFERQCRKAEQVREATELRPQAAPASHTAG